MQPALTSLFLLLDAFHNSCSGIEINDYVFSLQCICSDIGLYLLMYVHFFLTSHVDLLVKSRYSTRNASKIQEKVGDGVSLHYVRLLYVDFNFNHSQRERRTNQQYAFLLTAKRCLTAPLRQSSLLLILKI